MKIWSFEENLPKERKSLWKTLRLPESGCEKERGEACPVAVSFVGAGGKTSVMYRLADELAALGKRVIVTTSTHIFRPLDRKVVLAERAEEVAEEIKESFVTVVGRQALEPHKLMGLQTEEIGKLLKLCDVLLIEADGAKRLPLKVPKEGEPVIIPETDAVVACAGLSCIGKRFQEACFRYELISGVLGADVKKEDIITPEYVAEILLSGQGARKGTKERGREYLYRIVLNQADNEELRQTAAAVITAVRNQEDIPCGITCFGEQREGGI